MSANPHILALHIADFPVAVARALTPALRGRPVVTVSSMRAMGRVLAVSPEARQTGVHEGQRYPVARHTCPDAAFLTPDRESEVRAEHAILSTALRISPCIERTGSGRIAMDIRGTERLLGAPMDVASRLQREVVERHTLTAAIGLSSRRIWSDLASQAILPSGILEVLPAREVDFLGMIPPAWVPGVGPRTIELLHDMNITRLGMLRQFSAQEILHAFGAAGRCLLHAVGRGDADGPIPVVSNIATLLPLTGDRVEAEVPLSEESAGPDVLRGALVRAVSLCGEKLRRQRKECRRVVLRIGYGDGKNETAGKTLAERTAADSELLRMAEQLLATAHTRRVRLCRVTLQCEVSDRVRQASLFQEAARLREMRRLEAVDAIRLRFGESAIQHGAQFLAKAQ